MKALVFHPFAEGQFLTVLFYGVVIAEFVITQRPLRIPPAITLIY
jgi:hypothetical protein